MTTVNFTEEFNILPQYKDLEGIQYFTSKCAYKVLSYSFFEELKDLTSEDHVPGEEGGEMYLLNVISGEVERFTLWINDVDEVNEISFYVCLPTKEYSEDDDDLDDYLLDEFNIYYSAEHKCEPYKEDEFVREVCNDLVQESYYFINKPQEYSCEFEDAKYSYLASHFTINTNAATSEQVGKLYLNRVSFHNHSMQLEIFKDANGALYVIAAPCNCDFHSESSDCELKNQKVYLSDLNLNQVSQYIKG